MRKCKSCGKESVGKLCGDCYVDLHGDGEKERDYDDYAETSDEEETEEGEE